MPEGKTTTENQIFLTLLMVGSIVLGFFAVAFVSNAYETQNESELLYITDANTEFTNIAYDDVVIYSDSWFYNSCNRVKIGSNYSQSNLTILYSGNNTMTTAFAGNSGTFATNSLYVTIALPELENWIIHSINITSTANGDSDLNYYANINSHNNPHDATLYSSDISGVTQLSDYDISSKTEFELNEPVSLTKAIEILEKAKEKPLHTLAININDESLNGLSSFVWGFTIEIYGEQIPTWSIQDSLVAVLGGASFLNVLVGIYATDEIDLGTNKKHLGKR